MNAKFLFGESGFVGVFWSERGRGDGSMLVVEYRKHARGTGTHSWIMLEICYYVGYRGRGFGVMIPRFCIRVSTESMF